MTIIKDRTRIDYFVEQYSDDEHGCGWLSVGTIGMTYPYARGFLRGIEERCPESKFRLVRHILTVETVLITDKEREEKR